MIPVYLKHHEIDFKKWDQCILTGDLHLPYCLSWYLNIVSPGWEALMVNNYGQVFPLTFRKKAGINYLYQPYFTQQLGLFGSKVQTDDLLKFLTAIPEKFKFIEINLNQNCILNTKDFFLSGYKTTHHLNLKNKYQELFRLFNENTKRNIKKSENHRLKLNSNGNIDSLINMFRASAGLKTSLKPNDYKTLKLLMSTALKNKNGSIYEVRDESDNLLAGLFLLTSRNILINLFNASTTEGKKKSAMFFLINEILKQHSGTNATLDFEGSDIAAIAKFYKGFGGNPIHYPHIRLNRLPWPIKWIKK